MPETEDALNAIRRSVKTFYAGDVRPEGQALHVPGAPLRIFYQPLFSPPLPSEVPEYLQSVSGPAGPSIRIWEDHWQYRPAVVQARLRAKLGANRRVYARLTSVRPIPGQVARDFLEIYHLLGATVAKFKYGLFDREGNLLAVATFAKGRPITRGAQTYMSYELIRHANLAGTSVVGGLSKLLKAFIRGQQPDDIVTYVSLDWVADNPYPGLGFSAQEDTPAQWLYVNPRRGKRLAAHRLPGAARNWKAAYHPGNRKYVKLLK